MRFRLYTFSLLSFLRQRLGKYGWAKKLKQVKFCLSQLILLQFSGTGVLSKVVKELGDMHNVFGYRRRKK